ncbi:MAG: hypothetical protein IME92_00040 [Proteobacteria bacterium]|nr:hypothetical protein [Pseudomonadota bacterium]
MRERKAGSRFLYEPFDAASARLETHEQVANERWSGLERRLGQIEATLERLEKRLWLAVYGVVGFVLIRGVMSIFEMANR